MKGRSHEDSREESGEGVVSTAIAVLILAFLGAGMYFAFSRVLDKSSEKIDQQVDCIGQSAPAGFLFVAMSEREGAGLISTVFGFAAFLGFLTLAVQVSARAVRTSTARRRSATTSPAAPPQPGRLVPTRSSPSRSNSSDGSADGGGPYRSRRHATGRGRSCSSRPGRPRSIAVWVRRPLGLDASRQDVGRACRAASVS